MTKALITGVTGMVGSHLLDYLLDHTDWEIHGMLRWRSSLDNIRHWLPLINRGKRVTLFYGDLTDAMSVDSVVQASAPDYVFHLAAQSFPKVSFDSPLATLDTNIQGTERLLGALRKYRPDAIIHVCSSSEVFGRVPREKLPIDEECSFHPASPYAISKVGTDLIGRYYAEAYGMNVQTTRMFTHSVSRWTPVILRDARSGLIDVRYISELREAGKRGGYFSGRFDDEGTQIWDFTRDNLEVWNDGGWTKIKHLSCHPIGDHKMLEIATRSGVVDVTNNHSVIGRDGTEREAGKLAVGDGAKITPLPMSNATDLPPELAWLYGMFVAEGCLTMGKLRIDNKDRALLERCQRTLLMYLACDSYFVAGKGDMWRLTIRKPERFKSHFENCYAKDHNKRVPKLILNATKEAKLAFLRGYNEGDGRTTHPKLASEFVSFKTKSPILAMGLFVVAQEALAVDIKINVEHREAISRYFEVRPLNQTGSRRGGHLCKPHDEIVSITPTPYEGEVWDFETENHWFNAGIGGMIVHNTGPRRGDVFAESTFAKQIAMIEAKKIPPIIHTGNLDSLRTFADVRDAVRAYHMLLTVKPTPGAYYNIGGTHTCTIEEMLYELLRHSKIGCTIAVDPERLRPIDADLQVPDTSKFRAHTGWMPEIPFEKTMQDLLNYWRERVTHQDFLTR